jgi:hypothetical protein
MANSLLLTTSRRFQSAMWLRSRTAMNTSTCITIASFPRLTSKIRFPSDLHGRHGTCRFTTAFRRQCCHKRSIAVSAISRIRMIRSITVSSTPVTKSESMWRRRLGSSARRNVGKSRHHRFLDPSATPCDRAAEISSLTMTSAPACPMVEARATLSPLDLEDAPVVPRTLLREMRTLARGAALSTTMPSLLIVGREPRGTPNSAGEPVSADPMIVIDRFVSGRSRRR